MTPSLHPCFLKTLLVTILVAVGAVELKHNGFSLKFQADADFEVKSTVATYFCNVFAIVRVGKNAKNVYLFVYVYFFIYM